MGVMVQIIQAPAEGQKSPTGRPVPVQIAFQRDGYAFISAKGSGFNVGDQVIVEGNQNLRPGQPVMIKPEDNVLPAGSPTSQVGGVKVNETDRLLHPATHNGGCRCWHGTISRCHGLDQCPGSNEARR